VAPFEFTIGNTSRGNGWWGKRVAIYRLLKNSAFKPEDIRRMETAYEAALRQLNLIDRNDALTETVAKHIIEVAEADQKDPAEICKLVLKRLREAE
jgi:hypothetical protein